MSAVAVSDRMNADKGGLNSPPLSYSLRMKTDAIIISIDIETGAITGPIQGSGMRNRISHVKREAGQSRVIFRNT